MVKRIGGMRRKTRTKFKKPIRSKGKISITKYLQEFKNGETVKLHAEPAVQKGIYHPRFHGRVATVTGMKGKCYLLSIKDHNKVKEMIVHPVHLMRS